MWGAAKHYGQEARCRHELVPYGNGELALIVNSDRDKRLPKWAPLVPLEDNVKTQITTIKALQDAEEEVTNDPIGENMEAEVGINNEPTDEAQA